MAKLKDIKGSAIQYLAEDPVEYVGTWASSTSINTARAFGNGAGTTNANLYYGGSASPTFYNNTESWNGTAWTEVNDLNTARGSAGGMGTSTSAVCAGGRTSVPADTAASETWNGTSWTEGNDLNNERYAIANRGAGTQTAGLCAGGRNKGPATYDAFVEEYDGTSWTEVTDMPAGVESASGLGTQTAAGVWGGYTGSYRATGLLYDGTNWTSTTDFPFPSGSASEAGTTTAGLLFGIYNDSTPGYVANTVSWDGTAFTEENDLSTARGGGGGPKGSLNTSSSALMVSGKTDPGTSAATEEWSFPPSTSTILQEGQLWFNYTSSALKGYGKAAGIPAATWASANGLNVQRGLGGCGGVQTAAIYFGGPEPSYGGDTETYDGTSFTEVNEMNTGRVYAFPSGLGSTTSLLASGGETPAVTVNTETWDGTNWTEVNNLNTARYGGAGTGTQTAALASTGYTTTRVTNVESWDGTNWTEVAENNTARYVLAGFGTQTSTLIVGGNIAPNNVSPAIESWDGTAWTETTEMNTAKQSAGSAGVSGTYGLAYGGTTSPPSTGTATTESWNGSAWTEVNDLSAARGLRGQLQGASSLATLAVNQPGPASEEFTVTTAAVSTVTTS